VKKRDILIIKQKFVMYELKKLVSIERITANINVFVYTFISVDIFFS